MICQISTPYSTSIIFIIICLIIGFILILIGIVTQLHLNDYLKSSSKPEKDFLDTIFSIGTIRSSIERSTPVSYDILTQTISHHNTPSTTKTYQNNDLLLFDIEKENEIFKKECLRISNSTSVDHQSSPISVTHPHVHFLIK